MTKESTDQKTQKQKSSKSSDATSVVESASIPSALVSNSISPPISAPSSITLSTPPAPSKEELERNGKIKQIETALMTIRLYPVAATQKAKEDSVSVLISLFESSDDTLKQLILNALHEHICQFVELKFVHNFEFFKSKFPTTDPSQLRMNVYRSMFNYNTSLEGLIDLIRIVGELKNSDDSAKLLTYHFSHLASFESEVSHMLRSAVLEALGKSNSKYALNSLLEYAKYTDNERTFHRVCSALSEWAEKLDKMKFSQKEKDSFREQITKILSSDFGSSHYG